MQIKLFINIWKVFNNSIEELVFVFAISLPSTLHQYVKNINIMYSMY